VTGMLAPSRLDQLNEFLGAPAPIPKQVDEPSLTTSSLHGLSLDDKVATLSALQPSIAAAILGKALPPDTTAQRSGHCLLRLYKKMCTAYAVLSTMIFLLILAWTNMMSFINRTCVDCLKRSSTAQLFAFSWMDESTGGTP